MNTYKTTYKTSLTFNNKFFTVFVTINDHEEDDGDYHYNLELRTKEKISGDEFQKLKKYLEDEGYIDAAIAYYER